MGSPLAPVLANFFMDHYEKVWLNNYTNSKVLYYRRYVDDIICCFKNSIDARFFSEYLNSCHPNIKFTMETDDKGQLPFLNVLLSKQSANDHQGSFITSVYRKKTYTRVYLRIIVALLPLNANQGQLKLGVSTSKLQTLETSDLENSDLETSDLETSDLENFRPLET